MCVCARLGTAPEDCPTSRVWLFEGLKASFAGVGRCPPGGAAEGGVGGGTSRWKAGGADWGGPVGSWRADGAVMGASHGGRAACRPGIRGRRSRALERDRAAPGRPADLAVAALDATGRCPRGRWKSSCGRARARARGKFYREENFCPRRTCLSRINIVLVSSTLPYCQCACLACITHPACAQTAIDKGHCDLRSCNMDLLQL